LKGAGFKNAKEPDLNGKAYAFGGAAIKTTETKLIEDKNLSTVPSTAKTKTQGGDLNLGN